MNTIKTWQERIATDYPHPTDRPEKEYMQAEIDELRTALLGSEKVQQQQAENVLWQAGRIAELLDENEQLQANLETWKSNHSRLKAMVDDGSIADRTLSACLELNRENERLRAAAQAVIDRWDTPLWKDVPATAEYIGRLRAALGETK